MTKLFWLNKESQESFDHFVSSRYERFMKKGKLAEDVALLKSRRFALLKLGLLENDDDYTDLEQVFLPDWFVDKEFDNTARMLLTPVKETDKAVLFDVKLSEKITSVKMNDTWIPKSLLTKIREDEEK